MAAALALLSNVQSQTVSILNAHPGVWSPNVATNPVVGAYPSDAELTLAILQADEQVCTEGYFQSANDALATPFIVTSPPMVNGDDVPFHHGSLRATEVSKAALLLTQASITLATDTIGSVGHGMATGDTVTFILLSGALPTCGSPTFAVLTNYFVIKITDNSFKLARTTADAYAGTAIDILTAPTGSYYIVDWQIGVEAKNIDDITNAVQVGTAYVGSGAFNFLFKEDTGSIYTPARYCRLYYGEYVRTATLQSRQSEEFLVTCGAVRKLVKNASPAPFTAYIQESIRGLSQLQIDGQYTQMASEHAGGTA